jgi:predicted secreted protein
VLDDVRLYDYVLSSNQIAALMNTAPVLAAISNRVMVAGATLLVTNSATDAEAPAQTLTYGLIAPPGGATINSSNGIFSWRPLIAQGGATYPINVTVTDNGTPSLVATQSFAVTVNAPMQPGIAAAMISQGKFRMTISGDAGPDYSVLGSTNLLNWTLVQTTNSPVLPYLFIDDNSSNYMQRFYRVLLGP